VRKRGLDHETNKALIEKHLRKQGTVGAPISELRQVLPSLSDSGIKRLLGEMKKEGRVKVESRKRWSRWHAIL